VPIKKIQNVRGTAFLARKEDLHGELRKFIDNSEDKPEKGYILLPSFEEVSTSKRNMPRLL